MTTIDNSKAILDGVYSDAAVYVPANTTYHANTVLGRNAEGKLTAYSSDNTGTEPSYILDHPVENTTGSPVELPARVLECGTVALDKAVFVKAADAQNDVILTTLKNNGIRLVHVDYAN